MFPLNLQKNIDQLGKQISLLENECKNMEMEKKKRSLKPQPSLCSRASDNRVKPQPVVKIALKNASSSKVRKSTPPISARFPSTGSQLSQYSKTCSENGGAVRRKGLKVPAGSAEVLGNGHATSRKEYKCAKCICCNEPPRSELDHGDATDRSHKPHVLHKELLFPDSGGAIEVTVTQKPISGKENSSGIKLKSSQKAVNLENEVENDFQGCKCQIRGQKWAEILCADQSRSHNSFNDMGNNIADETRVVTEPLNSNNRKVLGPHEYYNNAKPVQQKEILEEPVKLPSQNYKKSQQVEINTNKFEKETQCSLDYAGHHMRTSEQYLTVWRYFLDQVLQRPTDENGKIVFSAESLMKLHEAQKREAAEEKKSNLNSISSSQNSLAVKNLEKSSCENLKKEKEILSLELSAKDSVIATLKKREDDYVALITSLKSSLEKSKEDIQERADAMKEINFYKAKLLQQIKVSEALKQNHTKMQEIVERCTLENDKLKTEIKIFKLEAQKHEVLLAGKEAQISRYKEEIQNFQRQISDHLASLKSNAQGIDIEKMMEAIVQQTHLFAQAEEDSVLENQQKDNSELQNALIHSTPHSSPPSTKSSVVNSSWKQISSIHGHEASRANSDIVVYLNEDSNKKDFLQVFGEKPTTQSKSDQALKERSVEDLLGKKEVKRSSSFTSCITTQEDQMSTKSSNHESLMSKVSTNSVGGRSDERLRKEKRASLEAAQSNIDKLLKDMKLKFSKEIFDTSLPSCSTEDLLDFSQISSVSPVQ